MHVVYIELGRPKTFQSLPWRMLIWTISHLAHRTHHTHLQSISHHIAMRSAWNKVMLEQGDVGGKSNDVTRRWAKFTADSGRRLSEHRCMARARRLLVSRLRAGAGKRYEAALGRSADLAAAAFDGPLAGTDTDAFQAVENELDTIAGEEIELDAQAQGAEEDDGAAEEGELQAGTGGGATGGGARRRTTPPARRPRRRRALAVGGPKRRICQYSQLADRYSNLAAQDL